LDQGEEGSRVLRAQIFYWGEFDSERKGDSEGEKTEKNRKKKRSRKQKQGKNRRGKSGGSFLGRREAKPRHTRY